jgi:hypothetical protein
LRKLQALQESMRTLPILDDRSHGEMLYDEHGAPRAASQHRWPLLQWRR